MEDNVQGIRGKLLWTQSIFTSISEDYLKMQMVSSLNSTKMKLVRGGKRAVVLGGGSDKLLAAIKIIYISYTDRQLVQRLFLLFSNKPYYF